MTVAAQHKHTSGGGANGSPPPASLDLDEIRAQLISHAYACVQHWTERAEVEMSQQELFEYGYNSALEAWVEEVRGMGARAAAGAS
jgi:hypothetical protein